MSLDTQVKIPTNIWVRGIKMSKEEIIKFQLMVHCYINSIDLSSFAIDIATGIGVLGIVELNEYAKDLYNRGIFAQEQGARTMIGRLEDVGIVVKEKREGTRKKLLYLHPSIGINNQTPICVDIKAICE